MTVKEVHGKKYERKSSLESKNISLYAQLPTFISKKSQMPTISVIMPAYNEEKAIGILIDRTQRVLQQLTENYEIIVINDGSDDETLQICKGKHITIIHNHLNRGKGYALHEGFSIAHGDIIITMDTDGDHKPEEIPLLIKPILYGKADFVIGSRFIHNNHVSVTHAVNLIGNRLFNFLINKLTNRRFTDTQCGFRAFKEICLANLNSSACRFEIETEMIVQLTRQNFSYMEVPISSQIAYHRKSHLNRLLDGFRILYTIFKTRLKKVFKFKK